MSVVGVVCEILEDAAAAEPGTVQADTPLGTIQGWDSMGVVFFLGEASARWPDKRVTTEAVMAARTPADLASLVA